MKILVWAGSTRRGSFNFLVGKKIAEELLTQRDGDQVTLREFAADKLPLYDGDHENAHGLPDSARDLVSAFKAADAVILVSPEYNGGIPGTLKNAIDWMSRSDGNVFADKPILLVSGSPGALGGIRGLWHTRVPLTALGANVYPQMVAISHVDSELEKTEAPVWARLKSTAEKFLHSARHA